MYLESSIPESFLDPLDRTKAFEILKRSIWAKFVKDGKFKPEDAFSEDTAIEAGKLAEADVVLIGSFAPQKDNMVIFAKAVDMETGRIIITRNKSMPLDNSMFSAIQKLADEMSYDMTQKLAPLARKNAKKSEQQIQEETMSVLWRNAVLPGLANFTTTSREAGFMPVYGAPLPVYWFILYSGSTLLTTPIKMQPPI